MAQNIRPEHNEIQDSPGSNSNSESVPFIDNQTGSKRLHKELMSLMMSAEKGISAFPEDVNIFKWIGTITGTKNTVYKGQKYRLSLEFPCTYPFSPPLVKFLTPCFHPNIDLYGSICLDMLKEKWSALYDVRTILLSIQSLLGDPNIENPLNIQAAMMWTQPQEYKKHLEAFYAKHKDK